MSASTGVGSSLEGLAARCVTSFRSGNRALCYCPFPDLLVAYKSLELRSAASTGVRTGALPCLQGEKCTETLRKPRSFKLRWVNAVFGDFFVLQHLLACCVPVSDCGEDIGPDTGQVREIKSKCCL